MLSPCIPDDWSLRLMQARMYYIGGFDFVLHGNSQDAMGADGGEDMEAWSEVSELREQLLADEL